MTASLSDETSESGQPPRGRGWLVAALVTALLSLTLVTAAVHAAVVHPWEQELRGEAVVSPLSQSLGQQPA